ncbi:hypothetical protein HHI36_000918 [Cryptolaemus montrouzieri]|uniref:Peptidase M14 domain-containing protein n=1 Tax=Cryptolaemus montrouzieri TaxID=559131 RepID=A0ABD2P657_9CUCU
MLYYNSIDYTMSFLMFGKYTEGKYIRIPENQTTVPRFRNLVPSFGEIEGYLQKFAKNYSYFASLYELGKTKGNGKKEGLPLYNMVLSSGYAKPIIVIIGGIYASDLACPLALMECFTEWTINTKVLAQLLPLYDYHFIPLINPEGYEFVYQKVNMAV